MSTVFIFHGTEGSPDENWFPWMKKELEQKGHTVCVPQFPSPPIVPSIIAEWFDVLKAYEGNINDESILIGHSLGCIFTLRLLERLDHRVKAVYFVGAPIGIQPIRNFERDKSFSGDFAFDWKAIRSKSASFTVFHSDNDPYVGLENGKTLAKELGVELTLVPLAGHFNAKAGYTAFPLLRDNILSSL